jgi:hypothetical protein
MAKYRKRPVIVEAEQWFPGKEIEGVEIVQREGVISGKGHGEMRFPQAPKAIIRTLEGEMEVSPGDWVIVGVENERYPCKDSIFKATYEPAEE